MAVEVRMSRLSPTMETGTIVRWLKKEGDSVASGDTLAEVETDKATMPLETFEDGKLLKILAKEGDTVKIDALIGVIGKDGEDISAIIKGNGAAPASSLAPERGEGQGERGRPSGAPPSPPTPLPAVAGRGERIKASPLAKKIAAERGIDLRSVEPSGPGGRIVQRDVPEKASPSLAGKGDGGLGFEPPAAVDIPLSNLRQTIARRLVQSKQTIPHFYLCCEVAMDRAAEFREELNKHADEGQKISFNDLIIRVVSVALAKHPEVNATFAETKIHRHGEINIGVAVATDDGLYVPVLRHVDQLSLGGISSGVRELANKAREKRLSAADLQGSGFTITNLGMFGVDHFFAIINPPEAAVLAVGAIKTKPLVDAAGRVAAGKAMELTLSCDHRVIDGASGAKFMQTVKDLLEQPLRLLL